MVSRERNAKLQASKQGGKSQLAAQKAPLKVTCPTCKVQVTSYNNFKGHMESKHPKLPIPPEEDVRNK